MPAGKSVVSDLPDLLVVRTSAMGDVIHTLPAVAGLRRQYPNTKIGWVIEERWVELLCSSRESREGPRSAARPLVDQIHVVNTKAWRHSLLSPETWRQIGGSLTDLRAPHYGVAIDFQGAIRSAVLARLSGASLIYGFARPREGAAKIFYTRKCEARGRHVVEQNISLADYVSGTETALPNCDAELPHDLQAETECDEYLREHRIEKPVMVSPGAGWGAKQWPAERFGEVARRLGEKDFKCLINFGPGEEAIAARVVETSRGCAREISLSITQLIAFMRRARLFIGGDSGPLHLAAALWIPTVAIFGPTDPARNGPFGNHSIVLRSDASSTSHKRRGAPETGLLQITVDQVVAAACGLLEEDLPKECNV